ncbi:MAG: family 78 glycoside hydrolase catalytic domain [Phycisphaerales bacterium]
METLNSRRAGRRWFMLACLMLVVCTIVPITMAAGEAGAGDEAAWLSTGVDADGRACPLFRGEFSLDQDVSKATLSIVGLGHHRTTINGQRVGVSVIDQPWSEYSTSIYEQSFDVTKLLRKGDNAIGVMLGNSFWHVGPVNDQGRFSKTDAMPDFSAGRNFLVRATIDVTLSDGSRRRVVSGPRWTWTDGPITFSHIYAGEDYDATREVMGWDMPGKPAGDWNAAVVVDAPKAAIVPFTTPAMKEFEVFSPRERRIAGGAGDGVSTYVFPQNCSSLIRFTVEGKAGAKIRFKPCEYMDPATGRVKFTYTWGTGKDIWHDYTLRDGEQTHQVIFCYEGAQFVEVDGAVAPGEANPKGLPVMKSVDMVHVRAACDSVGSFACSSKMQNDAHKIIDWAIRSNLAHVVTDCPHREKNGWQEQNWHMARALSYRYDTQAYMTKVLHDVRDTQLPDGHIPTNCPNYLVGVPPHGFWNEAPEWGISGVQVPWHLYEWYGDRETLAASLESMKKFVDYLSSTAKDGVITSNLGDWYDYGHGKGDGPSQWTPAEVSATAIWALGARTVADAAKVLGHEQAEAKYRGLYNTIRETFRAKFYDPATATTLNKGSCQAGVSTALCAGLIPDADRGRAVEAIVKDLEARGYQQTSGEVLQVFLIRALAESGRNDVLHKVYARRDRGSYGFMVESGLTTLPESWDAKPGTGNSLNHLMLGHLVEWHFAYVAGIRQEPGSIGWKRVVIQPDPGTLESYEASFKSPRGEIASKGKLVNGKLRVSIAIPAGVEKATLIWPGGQKVDLAIGKTAELAQP